MAPQQRSSVGGYNRGFGRGRGRARRRASSSRSTQTRSRSGTSTPMPWTSRPPTSTPSRSGIRAQGHESTPTSDAFTPAHQAGTASVAHSNVRDIEQSISGIHEEDADADIDALNEVVMAVDLRDHGTVGCAYYLARTETLYCMEDAKLGGKHMIELLKLHIEPTVVLVPSKINDEVIDLLDPELRQRGSSVVENHDQFRLPYLLQVRPSTEFRHDNARDKLVNLDIRAEEGPRMNFLVPGDFNEGGLNGRGRQEQLLRFAGRVDLDSHLSIGCAGGVISYLQRRRAVSRSPNDASAHAFFRISQLDTFCLKDSMYINTDTLQSLQIVETESHPNSHNQGPRASGSKEGLSVYGIFHHLACTTQGRQLLRQYFLRPTMALSVIKERHRSIAVFVRPDNSTEVDELRKNLRSVKPIRGHMLKLRIGVGADASRPGLSQVIWTVIMKFVFHALKIRDLMREVHGVERLSIHAKMSEKFEGRHLAEIGRQVSEYVDFEETRLEGRTVVKHGVDPDLDAMKRNLAGLDHLLNEVKRAMIDRVPASNRVLRIAYYPQLGFYVVCQIESVSGTSSGIVDEELPGWIRAFSTDAEIHYKTQEMVEMDSKFGDVYSEICDREIEILYGLAQSILQYEDLLSEVSDICGELDSLLALAQGAKQYKLVRPEMTKKNIVKISGGRHILQELTVASFIGNETLLVGGAGNVTTSPTTPLPEDRLSSESIEIGDTDFQDLSAQRLEPTEGPSIFVMTGPNYSGKSVYLKQVALIVYMAQVGSFVPADSACIGLTDKILTRISTRESVSRIVSAFMIDLQQVSLALHLATERSLLLIDEFGKGTGASDGAGLACGVLEHLLSLKDQCPKVIFATHYHELFENRLLKPTASLIVGNMEVRIDPKAAEVDNQITYLYNLRLGRSVSSFGTLCASKNGISPEITRRAEELIVLEARGDDLVAACAVPPASEAVELEEAERIARDFLSIDILSDIDARQMLEEVLSVTTTETRFVRTSREDTFMSTIET